MPGYGIGIFELQGIIILILTDRLISLLLGRYVCIVLIHTLIQHVRLFIGQRRTLRLKSVQDHLGHDLLVVIIREGYAGLGEMKPVAFLIVGDLHQLGDVTVGDIVHPFYVLNKLIAVLDDHQLVVADQFLLLELHCRADSEIILDRTPVGTAQDHCFILSITGIGIRNRIYQFSPSDAMHIVKPGHFKSQVAQVHDSRTIVQFRDELADQGRVVQDSRLLLLTHHRGQLGKDGSSHHGHIIPRKCRRSIQTYWRKLCRVPYKDHLAAHPRTDESDQVFKEISCTESRRGLLLTCVNSYQRHLIHHEKSLLVLVRSQGELSESVATDSALAVYMLMDREGGTTRIGGKYLGRTAGRCQKHALCLELHESVYHRGYCSGLTGSCISVHNEDVIFVRTDKVGKLSEKIVLTWGRLESETGQEASIQEISPSHYLSRLNMKDRTIRTGNISNRPKNMSKVKMSLAIAGCIE